MVVPVTKVRVDCFALEDLPYINFQRDQVNFLYRIHELFKHYTTLCELRSELLQSCVHPLSIHRHVHIH